MVRIENTKVNEIGAGFIVKITNTRAYVVTAAHIVRGDQNPRVYLFGGRDQVLSATVIDREEDDLKGLALLAFAHTPQILSHLAELKLAATADLGDGENVTFIGVSRYDFLDRRHREYQTTGGQESRSVGVGKEGSSGGPVVLNQHAVGLVTDVTQSDIYAARAETIVLYVNGFETNLVTLSNPEKLSVDEFCAVLTTLIDAAKDDFYSIVGEPVVSGTENHLRQHFTPRNEERGCRAEKRSLLVPAT